MRKQEAHEDTEGEMLCCGSSSQVSAERRDLVEYDVFLVHEGKKIPLLRLEIPANASISDAREEIIRDQQEIKEIPTSFHFLMSSGTALPRRHEGERQLSDLVRTDGDANRCIYLKNTGTSDRFEEGREEHVHDEEKAVAGKDIDKPAKVNDRSTSIGKGDGQTHEVVRTVSGM